MAHRHLLKTFAVPVRNNPVPQASNKLATSGALRKQEPKITTLPSGLVIASVDNHLPVSKVTFIYKAGSRYERGATIGINHMLRKIAGYTTQGESSFGLVSKGQEQGSSMECSSGREHISYSIDCTKDNLEGALHLVQEASTRPKFVWWDIFESVVPQVKIEMALYKQNPEVLLMEALHKAAYRGGLGNSSYCQKYNVGKHEIPLLDLYVKQHHTTNRLAVVGCGIDHDKLVELVNKLPATEPGPGAETVPSKYVGDEIRKNKNFPVTYGVIATEGAALTKPQEVIALGILQQILGVGTMIKGVTSGANKLTPAISKSVLNPFIASAININYSDSGLFGFYVAALPDDIGKALKAGVGVMNACTKSGGISDKDVQNGKRKVKAGIHMGTETSSDISTELGFHALMNKQLVTPADVEKMIDAVTTADITNIAKKIMTSKPSMAVVGNLNNTPYLDQLLGQ